MKRNLFLVACLFLVGMLGAQTVIIDEMFDGQTPDAPVVIADWDNVAVEGTRDWQAKEYDGNLYAQGTAYNSNEANEFWLVLPGVDFDMYTDEVFKFESKDGYDNGEVATLLASADYTGNPAAATWVEIPVTFSSGNTSGYGSDWIPSGDLDFSALEGMQYIAFRYIGNGDGSLTTTLQIDNVMLTGNEATTTGYTVTFSVDMSTCDSLVATDVVYVTGSMLGWAEPGADADNQTLTDEDGDGIFTKTLTDVAAGEIQYKYFLNGGWDGGEWTGDPNRMVEITEDVVLLDVWGPDAINPTVAANVNVYPNPFANTLTIDNMENIQQVEIFNLAGQLVQALTVNGASSVSLETAGLAAGAYLVVFTDDNFNQGTTKLMKK